MNPPVIVVTGASRGIGRAVTEELLARGSAVVGAARDVTSLPAGDRLVPVAADVTTDAGREAVITTALDRFQRIDGLVNNVGGAIRKPAMDTTVAEFRQVLELNLVTTFAFSQLAYPHLKATRGAIVNVSSVVSRRVLPVRIAYATAKAGLDHLTRSLAAEWGPDGIRVNAVLPWFTRTAPIQKILEDRALESRLIAATPLGRLGEPADVARAVAFLALPDSAYITGQLLAVDGGYLARGLV